MITIEQRRFLERIGVKERSILSFLFPTIPVFKDELPFFYNQELCFLLREDFRKAPYQNVISICLNSNGLEKRENFIEFLKLTIKITSEYEQELKFMSEERFYSEVKLLWVLKKKIKIKKEDNFTLFDLFQVMFFDFEKSLKIYNLLDLHRNQVFYGLVSMMEKTKIIGSIRSKKYKRILIKNKQYLTKFKSCCVEYLKSKNSEMDFLIFLFNLSGGKN